MKCPIPGCVLKPTTGHASPTVHLVFKDGRFIMVTKARCDYVAYPGWPLRWRCVLEKGHPNVTTNLVGHEVAFDGEADAPRKKVS